ncbi:MAG: S-layer homology domain-containing protein [Armatimonadota bacterium]
MKKFLAMMLLVGCAVSVAAQAPKKPSDAGRNTNAGNQNSLLIEASGQPPLGAPNDVPRGHWAYDAVNELAGKGYVPGYPNGDFLGDRTLTRYEFATIVARILEGVNEKLAAKLTVSAQDLDKITKLAEEFKVELTVIGTKLGSVEAAVTDLDKKPGNKKDQEMSAPTVTTATKGSTIKIDGRIFVGLFGTEKQGPFPNWSTDIPDAKLRFTFNPAKNITIVNRFNTSGAKTADFDYFYLDYCGLPNPTSSLRLGQRKIDVGQETWVDNPIENMLITNSVSHVSGYGIGLATLGRFGSSANAPVYEIGFVNGPKGVTTRPSTGLPVNVKVGAPILGNLFASASYFTTGRLGANDKSAISVAEISDAPAGALDWQRNLWELDLRYNYGPIGIRPLDPIGKLPPLMLGATYGRFDDDATGAADRTGSYWFGECLYRLSPKFWASARYSVTELGNGMLAKLAKSPVAVNSYKRTSIGLGYAITSLVEWKAEYTINDTSGGASQPGLNQWATGIAAKF